MSAMPRKWSTESPVISRRFLEIAVGIFGGGLRLGTMTFHPPSRAAEYSRFSATGCFAEAIVFVAFSATIPAAVPVPLDLDWKL